MLHIQHRLLHQDIQRVIDAHKSIIWTSDCHGRLTYFNPVASSLLLHGADVLSIDAWIPFIHEEDRPRIHVQVTDAKRAQCEYRAEYRLTKSDGTSRRVIESAAPRFGPAGDFAGYVGSIVDISGHRDAIEALTGREAEYRMLAEYGNDLIAHVNADGCYVYTSPSYAVVLGYSPEELRRAYVYDFVHPDDAAPIRAEVTNQVSHGAEARRLQIRKRRKDGTYEWFAIRAKVMVETGTQRKLGSIVVCTSIHGEKLAQEALEEQMRRLQSWAQVSTDLIWEVDLRTNRVWRSAQAESVYGLNSNAARDDYSWEERIHPDDRARVIAGFQRMLDGHVERWSDEYRLRVPDGSYTHVFDKGAVLRDASGRMISLVGSFVDLTAQKKAEIELSRLNRALNLRSACSQLLVRARDRDELLNGICRLALDVGGYGNAWIAFAEDDASKTVRVVATAANDPDKDILFRLLLSWDEAAPGGIGRGPAGQAIRSGTVQVIEHIDHCPAFAPWRGVADRCNAKGAICLPLKDDGRTTGVMMLYTHEPLTPSDDELELLESLANELSFGITHLRVRAEEVRMRTAVATVAAGVSTNTEHLFFEQIAIHMAEAVRADAALISLFSRTSRQGQIVAAVVRGQVVEKYLYDLNGTPCSTLFAHPLCVVEDGMAERYPKAAFLGPERMQACVGARLENGVGDVIGSVSVLYANKIPDASLVASSMRIFSARVASELERMKNIATIHEQASLLDKAKDAIIVHDLDGRIVFWNMGAEKLYGWTAEDALGNNIALLQPQPDEFAAARAILDACGEWSGDLEQRTRDGKTLSIRAGWTLVRDADGAPQSIFSISTDVTQAKADQNKIATLAYHDQLTGLPNRQALLERLHNEIGRQAQARQRGALLFIDLDNFKSLNDTRGHDQGDRLLQQVAARLLESVRHTDLVARLGGDEFVVMQTGLSLSTDTAMRAIFALAEKVRACLSETYQIGAREHHITPSIGIAVFSDDALTVSEILKRADMAMYRAKEMGKNRVCLFDPAMENEMIERAHLESDFRHAIHAGQFVLEYQPQIHTHDGIIGFEALVRWKHPDKGIIAPAKFITFAEESGLIVPLGLWILEAACNQVVRWQDDPALGNTIMAVNISARQLRDPMFVQNVTDILRHTGAPAGRLKLELTESMLVENIEETISKMQQLRAAGVSFALDDFGTGFSSLSYLKQLPIDTLKIDRSFVRDILTDSNDAAIARTIVALAQSLNLDVIAEGVETESERDVLVNFGCDCHQGYLYGRPMPPEAVMDWVLAQAA